MRHIRNLVLSTLALGSSCTLPVVNAAGIQTISKVGRYLYGADENRFYVKVCPGCWERTL